MIGKEWQASDNWGCGLALSVAYTAAAYHLIASTRSGAASLRQAWPRQPATDQADSPEDSHSPLGAHAGAPLRVRRGST